MQTEHMFTVMDISNVSDHHQHELDLIHYNTVLCLLGHP